VRVQAVERLADRGALGLRVLHVALPAEEVAVRDVEEGVGVLELDYELHLAADYGRVVLVADDAEELGGDRRVEGRVAGGNRSDRRALRGVRRLPRGCHLGGDVGQGGRARVDARLEGLECRAQAGVGGRVYGPQSVRYGGVDLADRVHGVERGARGVRHERLGGERFRGRAEVDLKGVEVTANLVERGAELYLFVPGQLGMCCGQRGYQESHCKRDSRSPQRAGARHVRFKLLCRAHDPVP